jgi:hypothetical protein
MHATMRSIGAEFAWVNLVHTYEGPDFRRVPIAVYPYRVDVNDLGIVRPLFNWGRIDLLFYTDEGWQRATSLDGVAFHIAVPFSPSISGLKEDLPQTRPCPPVPADAERPAEKGVRNLLS